MWCWLATTSNGAGEKNANRCGCFIQLRQNQTHSHQRYNQFHFRLVDHFRINLISNSRNNKSWRSVDTTVVRTVAWNVFVSSISGRSWIYPPFFELLNCAVQFGSESARKCQQFDAESADDAKCYTAKIAKVAEFWDGNFEQLRYVAWWMSGRYNEVTEKNVLFCHPMSLIIGSYTQGSTGIRDVKTYIRRE